MGRLSIEMEIHLEEIKKKQLAKQLDKRAGEGGKPYYILSLSLDKNREYEYRITEEYLYAVNKIFSFLEIETI